MANIIQLEYCEDVILHSS